MVGTHGYGYFLRSTSPTATSSRAPKRSTTLPTRTLPARLQQHGTRLHLPTRPHFPLRNPLHIRTQRQSIGSRSLAWGVFLAFAFGHAAGGTAEDKVSSGSRGRKHYPDMVQRSETAPACGRKLRCMSLQSHSRVPLCVSAGTCNRTVYMTHCGQHVPTVPVLALYLWCCSPCASRTPTTLCLRVPTSISQSSAPTMIAFPRLPRPHGGGGFVPDQETCSRLGDSPDTDSVLMLVSVSSLKLKPCQHSPDRSGRWIASRPDCVWRLIAAFRTCLGNSNPLSSHESVRGPLAR